MRRALEPSKSTKICVKRGESIAAADEARARFANRKSDDGDRDGGNDGDDIARKMRVVGVTAFKAAQIVT